MRLIHWEFPLSSSTHHKQLFNFLLLQGEDEEEIEEEEEEEDEDSDDDKIVELTLGWIVTRNCGNTLGSILLLLSTTSSCINL